MNDMTVRPPNQQLNLTLPRQMELERQEERMIQVAMSARYAAEATSYIYRQNVFTAIMTLQQTALIERALPPDMRTAEIDEQLLAMKKDYLEVMHQIPKDECDKIVKILQEAPLEWEDFGLRKIVLDTFLRFLNKYR